MSSNSLMKDVLSAYYPLSPLLSFHPQPSHTASLDTFISLLNLPVPMQALFLYPLLLSRFLTQDNQERNGTAPIEWPIDSQEFFFFIFFFFLCASKGIFSFPDCFGLPVWAWKQLFCLFLTVAVLPAAANSRCSGTVTDDGERRENKGRRV